MKKKTILSLAAAAVFACAPASSLLPALAVSQEQTASAAPAVTTADDFISRYAGSRIQTVSKDKTVTETFVYFTRADQNNMALLLEGKKVYDTLPESVRKDVDARLKKAGCDYAGLTAAAAALQAQAEKDKAAQAEADKAEQKDAAAQQKAPEAEKGKEAESSAKAETENTEAKEAASKETESKEADVKEADAGKETGQSQPQQKEGESQPAAETDDKAKAPAAEQKPSGQDTSADKKETDQPAQAETGKPADKTEPEASGESASKEKAPADKTSPESSAKPDVSEKTEAEDKAETTEPEVRPAADPNVEQSLESSSLNGQGSLKGKKISLQFTAYERAPEEEGLADALKAMMQDEYGVKNPVLYTGGVYAASCDGFSASAQGLHASKNADGKTLVFQAYYDEEAQAWHIDELSSKSFSFDFTTQSLHLPVVNSYRYAFVRTPEVPAEESKAPSVPVKAPMLSFEDGKKPASDQASADNEEKNLETQDEQKTPQDEEADLKDPQEDMKDPAKTPEGEDQKQPEEPAAPEQKEPEAEKETLPVPVPETKVSAAQSFVDSYCSNGAGQVYAAASSWNYRQILNGFDAWRELNSSDKSEVNAILARSGGSTFQSLYRAANQIRLGVPVQGYGSAVNVPQRTENPSTASATFETFYLTGAALSLFGLFAAVAKSRGSRNRS